MKKEREGLSYQIEDSKSIKRHALKGIWNDIAC